MPDSPSTHRAVTARLLPWPYLLGLLALLVIGCAAVVAIAEGVRASERRSLDAEAENRASGLAAALQERIDCSVTALAELRREWDARSATSRQWQETVTRYLRQPGQAYQSVARIRWDGQPAWQYPEKSALHESDLARDGRWGEAFELARADGQDIATRVLTSESSPRVGIVLVTLRSESAGSAPSLIVGILDLQQLTKGLMPAGPCQQCRVELREGADTFLTFGPPPARGSWPRERQVQFLKRTWEVRYTSGPGHVVSGGAARWVLWAGLPAWAFVTVLLHEVLAHRRRATIQTARYQAALELLSELTAATASKIGSTDQMLPQLADAARQLMRMNLATVAQFDSGTGKLRIRAISGQLPAGARRDIPINELPMVRRCLETGEILLEPDVERLSGLNPEVNREFGVRAVVLIPLHLDGRRVGLLGMSDPRPRRFTDADRRLAALLASHAEVILANNSLYEQMRGMLVVRDRLLGAQEELYRTSVAMYHAGTLADSLRALAERAPAAIPAELCMVLLLTERKDELEVVAACGEGAPQVLGRRVPAPGSAGMLLEARQPRFIDDAAAEANLETLYVEPGRGVIQAHLPLVGTDRTALGLLVLTRKAPGAFTPAERALAQVFAERAAAGIENARLQEQTRRDAQARALLLSELHHRVKNNLAGIIGLLSLDAPDVSPPARQWLDRVIERIGAMARAHDLFAGGLDKLPLNRLVEQVVPSLSVLRPHSVPIAVDAQADGAVLGPSQAVSLAMVLHELCANALQHAGGSPVAVHASHHDGVAHVQVADRGPGPMGDAQSNGVGLTLVRELVRRELKGTFTLGKAEGGGTVADIQFPVEQHTP